MGCGPARDAARDRLGEIAAISLAKRTGSGRTALSPAHCSSIAPHDRPVRSEPDLVHAVDGKHVVRGLA
jgi:hypothetical protein